MPSMNSAPDNSRSNTAVPSVTECLSLMERYGMFDNIRAHSQTVARVAQAIFNGLEEAGTGRDLLPPRELVVAGALLHDIAKSICLQADCLHAQKGHDICLELGFPDVAEIVAEHVLISDLSPSRYSQGIFRAKEIVYYADKRVRHDTIVSLDERLAYILERYGQNKADRVQRIEDNFNRCRTLELHLFTHLPFSREELAERVTEIVLG